MKQLSKSHKALICVYSATIIPLINVIRIVLGVDAPSTFDIAFLAVSHGLILCVTITGPSILNKYYVDDIHIEIYALVRYLTMYAIIIASLLSIQIGAFTNDETFFDYFLSIILIVLITMIEIYVVYKMINTISESLDIIRDMKRVKK